MYIYTHIRPQTNNRFIQHGKRQNNTWWTTNQETLRPHIETVHTTRRHDKTTHAHIHRIYTKWNMYEKQSSSNGDNSQIASMTHKEPGIQPYEHIKYYHSVAAMRINTKPIYNQQTQKRHTISNTQERQAINKRARGNATQHTIWQTCWHTGSTHTTKNNALT